MTAAAAATAAVTSEGEQAIATAKAILGEDRGMTVAEDKAFREVMHRLGRADNGTLATLAERLTLATLQSLCAEINRLSQAKIQSAAAAENAEVYAKRAQYRNEKGSRWRALHPAERAGYRLFDEAGGTYRSMGGPEGLIGRALLRFGKLLAAEASDVAAKREPSQSFEEDE
jgi:hypothetical protein